MKHAYTKTICSLSYISVRRQQQRIQRTLVNTLSAVMTLHLRCLRHHVSDHDLHLACESVLNICEVGVPRRSNVFFPAYVLPLLCGSNRDSGQRDVTDVDCDLQCKLYNMLLAYDGNTEEDISCSYSRAVHEVPIYHRQVQTGMKQCRDDQPRALR